MKYICFLVDGDREEIITFPRTINHDDMSFRCKFIGDSRLNPVSAGFVSTDNGCYGKSMTLDLKARAEDTTILRGQLENI